jgi:aminoglycoside/choline kinase family phosphotransferase
MIGPRIPAGPESITPEWLNDALHSTGIIARATVISSEIERIGEKKAYTARLARLRLNYDIEDEDAPKSLVAKFPAADPKLRTILNYSRLYEREIRFYREIAGMAGLRTPRCYYSALDLEAVDSVLLLEDLGQARLCNNITGCSLNDAEHAIHQLAKFHANWWNSPRLKDLDWMPAFSDGASSFQDLYLRLWGPYVEKFKDQLPDLFVDLGDRLGKNVANLRKRLGKHPRTIVHGDYRLDNLIFGLPGSHAPLTVIDWQVAMRGRGASDVGYFLVHSLPSKQRREVEMHLLKAYYSTLLEHSVCEYEFNQCLYDYRLSILHMLLRMVVQGSFLDFSNERSSGRETVLYRCAVAMEDHNVAELL